MGQARLRANEIKALKGTSIKLGSKYVTPLFDIEDPLFEGKTPFQHFMDSEFHQAAIEMVMTVGGKEELGFVFLSRNKDEELGRMQYDHFAKQDRYTFSYYCPLDEAIKMKTKTTWSEVKDLKMLCLILTGIGAAHYWAEIENTMKQFWTSIGVTPPTEVVAAYGMSPIAPPSN